MYRHLLLGSAALKVLHRSKMPVLVHKPVRCRMQVRGRMTPEKKHPGKPGKPFWYWLLVPAAFILFSVFVATQRVPPLAYSDFDQLLYAGKVNEVMITDMAISGSLNADGLDKVLSKRELEQLKCTAGFGCAFTTMRVDDPSLVDALEAADVRFIGQEKTDWLSTLMSWLIPIALFFYAMGLARKEGGHVVRMAVRRRQKQGACLRRQYDRRDL